MHVNTPGIRRKDVENAQPVCDLTMEDVFSVRINQSLVERERKKYCALKRCQMFSSSEITVTTRRDLIIVHRDKHVEQKSSVQLVLQ